MVEQLVRAMEEVDERHRTVVGEEDFVELLQKFPVMSTHKGPKGYTHARVVLEANDSVMLSFCGEEECQRDVLDSRRGSGAKDGGRSSRSNSLTDGSRRKSASSRQMVRSRSLLHTKGKSEHLLDPGDASDHCITSRTSTPTSRQSALTMFDNIDVYEEESSLSVLNPAASPPEQPPRNKKTHVNKDLEPSPSDLPSGFYQDTADCRQRTSENEHTRPQRPRGPRGRGPRRRRADRENHPSGHRRPIQTRCSLM